MTGAPSTRFGPYEVTSILGAGGMGEVYRARDPRLDRDVALKVLPPTLTVDVERLARFKREAMVLASLNHPNIAAVYGLEEGRPPGSELPIEALVLELVEGPTLAERIAGGPLPPDEARAIGIQIAAALEAAHERGIVHREAPGRGDSGIATPDLDARDRTGHARPAHDRAGRQPRLRVVAGRQLHRLYAGRQQPPATRMDAQQWFDDD